MKHSKVDLLREELVAVANQVKHHKEVAKEKNISTSYLLQIRNGENAMSDTIENRELIQSLIDLYRRIGREQLEELEKTLSND